jgi:hypothetical protein
MGDFAIFFTNKKKNLKRPEAKGGEGRSDGERVFLQVAGHVSTSKGALDSRN